MEKLLFASIGVCGVLILFTFINQSVSRKRKSLLFLLSVAAIILCSSEYVFAIYNGAPTNTGGLIAKTSKFAMYATYPFVIFLFTRYLEDVLVVEGKLETVPKALRWVERILVLSLLTLGVSQPLGIYYTFDSNNTYQREGGYFLSYLYPSVAISILILVTIKNRRRLRRRMFIPLLLFSVMPLSSSIAHFFARKISMTSIFIVAMVILLYCFTILDANDIAKDLHQRELRMIRETTDALVGAIDAKDSYTKGHSKRVAEYSVMIAEKAGKSEEECGLIYLTALLHDVGKIGVPDTIINKRGRLNSKEYAVVKTHTTVGREILEKITTNQALARGAAFHHERYDGKGYPFGLRGDEIPEVARIIAVADSYDAMASKRSYRDVLSKKRIRSEFVEGIGTQFDPKFAKIMLELIDSDTEFEMREK